MSIEGDTRDRVIRMEAELESLKDKVESLDKKVDKIHTILTEARGASRAIQFLVWLSGTSLFVWVATYWKNIAAFIKGAQ